MTKPKPLSIIVLGLILWVAFTLRIYRLDHHAIWGDEAFSINVAMMPLAKIVAGGTDTHPPLYHTLLHFWMSLAGSSAFGVRFLSVIPGMLLIAVIYSIGHRLMGRWPATLAAGLAAVSAFMIYYSQETRMYAWAAMLTALSVYAFLRLVDAADAPSLFKRSGFWLPAYFVVTLAAMYSHYYVFFVILAQNLYALRRGLKHRSWLLGWISVQLALAIAYLPWIIAQMGFLSGRANTRLDAWGLSGMQDVWVQSLISFGGGTSIPTQFNCIALVPTLLVICGMVGVIKHQIGTGKRSDSSGFVVLYLVVPMLVAWLVGPFMPFFYERYLLVAFPAYLLLLAAGLITLFRIRAPFFALGGLGCALAIGLNLYSLNNYYHNPAYAKSGYRDLMAYVTDQSRSGDAFLLLNPEQRDLYNYYGFKDIPAYWFPPPDPWESPSTRNTMSEVESHQRLWLVLFGNASDWDFGGSLQNWLNSHAFRAYHGDFIDGGLELYILGDVEPSEPTDANFAGMISLTAYGISSTNVNPGDTLQVALSWKAVQKMDSDYTIFTHLVDDQQQLWGQMDSPPAGGSRPTSSWNVDETFVDRLAFQVDPNAPPGTYWLEIGWYDLTTLNRLPVFDAQGEPSGDKVLLVQINIH